MSVNNYENTEMVACLLYLSGHKQIQTCLRFYHNLRELDVFIGIINVKYNYKKEVVHKGP